MHDGIYKRNDSPYWWASWTEAGRTIRKSTGIRITDDPRGTAAKRVRAGLLSVEHQPVIERRWIDLVGQYIADKRASWRPNTMREYRHALRHLVAFFGEDSGLQSRAEVKAYLRHAQTTLAPGSINTHVALMNGAYRHAQTELELDIVNPWERRALRVDMDAGTISFDCSDQKNGKRATLPINAGARLALGRLMAKQKGPHVFHQHGRKLEAVDMAFHNARVKAGLPDVKIHDLRRTFGSWLVQSGVSIHAVSGLLRHSDIRITARVYAHLGVEEFREAASVLDQQPKLRVMK